MSGSMGAGGNSGFAGRVAATWQSPFGNSITWLQLAAATVFVLCVILAWRQVTTFIVERV